MNEEISITAAIKATRDRITELRQMGNNQWSYNVYDDSVNAWRVGYPAYYGQALLSRSVCMISICLELLGHGNSDELANGYYYELGSWTEYVRGVSEK